MHEHVYFRSIREYFIVFSLQLQPQISMGPSGGKQYDPLEELDSLDQPKTDTKSKSESSSKNTDKSVEKKTSASSGSGGSWFGDLFSKLALKPKNQMILPDDNNPAVFILESL